jgi:hypothetical protein
VRDIALATFEGNSACRSVIKIPNAFIIFMYICNVNVISTRYEASSRDTYH